MTADALHAQYMKAAAAYREHANGCGRCSPNARCTVGERLFETFARHQDAYLAWLRKPRP
ncbi:hypothetical protein [Streptomyces sp. NPDC050600]|uniref:hypothetical protein n=1 Tax=Streptomyces sp. NPDC050600 TaxID=3157213 RepID=UPI0034169447